MRAHGRRWGGGGRELPALWRPAILAALVFGLAFLALLALVAAGRLDAADRYLVQALAPRSILRVRRVLIALGQLGGLAVPTLAVAGLGLHLVRRGRRGAALGLLAYPAGLGAEAAIKLLFRHPGPPVTLAPGRQAPAAQVFLGTEYSTFPSGHAIRSIIVCGLLGTVTLRLGRGRTRWAAIVLLLLVVLVETAGRVYIRVHWASDVVGGALLGTALLALAVGWMWPRLERRPRSSA